MKILLSPRYLSVPTARWLGSVSLKARAWTLRDVRAGRVTRLPLESALARRDCLPASRRMSSTFPSLFPTASRSSKAGSGDHAKHFESVQIQGKIIAPAAHLHMRQIMLRRNMSYFRVFCSAFVQSNLCASSNNELVVVSWMPEKPFIGVEYHLVILITNSSLQ